MTIFFKLSSKLKFLFILVFLLSFFCIIDLSKADAATYYLSPSGSDTTGTGTISSPWFTLNKAWTAISAGDTIYLRGGTYSFNTQQRLTGKNGTSGNLIKVWAYPGETPNLTKSGSYTTNAGVFFKGDYVHFKGLEISGYTQITSGNSSGIRVENSNYNIFESLNIHHNGLGMDFANLGYTEHATGNLILNSDFHHNQDPLTSGDPYGNADGLSLEWITHAEDTNTIRGCRSWSNTDDGYDFYRNEGTVIVENSSAFLNGYIPDTLTTAGDGNGFKLGPTVAGYPSEIKRYVNNTIAFKNRMNGYDINGARTKIQFLNNTSYQNGNRGFRMADDTFGENLSHIAKNNISYQNVSYNSEFSPASVLSYNTFLIGTGSTNSNYSVTSSDFLSTDSTGMDGARQADGSWPSSNFLKLAAGSDLIDAGIDVGILYNDSAPDIGVYESSYVVSDTTAPTISSFNIPATSSSLTVSFVSLSATDAVGVTGYLVTETSSTPSVSSGAWSMSFPSYTFSTEGTKTLYAWAKDAAGNVSISSSNAVTITLPINTYILTITKAGTGTGIVTGANSYNSGMVVVATSTPNSDSTFISWGGDCNVNGQVTMTSDKVCIATFGLIPVSSGGGGGGGSSSTSSTSNTSATASVPTTSQSTASPTSSVSPVYLPSTYLFTVKMTIGTKNTDVKELQKILIEKGYLLGVADGSFGPKTLAAVKRFQATNNLVADGIVGAGTRAVLNTLPSGSAPTVSQPSVTSAVSTLKLLKYCKYLSKGNDINEVKKLQQILISKGYLANSNIDGIFGKGTLAAVISFQKANGLTSDGVVGMGTIRVLNGN